MKYTIYCDGITEPNPGRGAWAFAVYDEDELIHAKSAYMGDNVTNNMAEYAAMIEALVWAHELENDEVTILSDSQLVVNQLNGVWQVKSEKLQSWYDNAKDLIEPHVTIGWVKGADNRADEATRLAYAQGTGFYPHPREKGEQHVKMTPVSEMPNIMERHLIIEDAPF